MRPRRHNEPSMQETFEGDRCDYEASKRGGRFQRRRRGVPAGGAGADWHYRSESDYLFMGETARDMCRNDAVIGQLVDRAVVNTISTGFTPEPKTPDEGLNKEVKARWLEEAADPDYCDVAGELTFHEQEEMVLRETLTVGDVFGVPIADDHGTVELREFHRCRSPSRTTKNIVHGIQLDQATRRKERFYFTKEPIEPLSQASIRLKDLAPEAARDHDGEAAVFHVLTAKRPSQTRGVSALAPVIVPAGMFDDLNFANLLKAQLNSHWMLVRNRASTFDFGTAEQPAGIASTQFTGTRRVEETGPGSEIGGAPGETIIPWTPNTPNAEFFPHAKLILTLIGINIGMPLCLLLLDASETNFSGFRGAVDQARMGFRRNQRILIAKWHRPYYRFKLHHWADHEPAFARLREHLGKDYLAHTWQAPGWPYIEPMKDATTDLVRAAHMQTSPRRLQMERGNAEWGEIVTETVFDRALAIRAAAAEAQKLNKEFGLEEGHQVSWRDLAPLPLPERVTVSLNASDGAQSNDAQQNAGPEKKQ